MAEFKIRRGLSTTLFVAPGVINSKLIIEEGCWYLCTDTAELFLGIQDSLGNLTLKRINEVFVDSAFKEEFKNSLAELKNELVELQDIELFQKITSETDLPTDFENETFNPNITYYIPVTNDKVNTYIFDKDSQSYMCTGGVDELVLRAMVTELIEVTIDEKFDKVLDEKLSNKVPEIVKETIEKTILYGGDSTPEDES